MLLCKEFILAEDCSLITMRCITFWCGLGVPVSLFRDIAQVLLVSVCGNITQVLVLLVSVCNCNTAQVLAFLLVSVCCNTAQVLAFLLVSVCCDTAQALVVLLVLVCCDTAQALVLVCCDAAQSKAVVMQWHLSLSGHKSTAVHSETDHWDRLTLLVCAASAGVHWGTLVFSLRFHFTVGLLKLIKMCCRSSKHFVCTQTSWD